MKKYVVHVTNPTSVDQRISLVGDELDLATVAHQAINQAFETQETRFDLPLFIDIHAEETAPTFDQLHTTMPM